MKKFKNIGLMLTAVTFVTSAWAQGLEIIALHHRPAEELLPQVRPVVEPGGMLTGSGDKLFLRASSRNAQQVRQVVAALDRPLRRLLITLRQGREREGADVHAGANVRLSPGDSRISGSLGSTSRSGRRDVMQQVQTVEGGTAFINVGRSLFLPFRQAVVTPAGVATAQSIVRIDIGSGFAALPRLVGERVTIEISPRQDTQGPLPGSVDAQRLSASVSGSLGEWIALGGSTEQAAGSEGGLLRHGSSSGRDERQVWLKVDALP